ncbi:LOW QUALITY PROTEIN: capping protein inhibiting regulator of actin dynamics-like [Polyodon spathula]|uniref:LOW QUALITY PROTEIN: capping protein inhibiting regulator of actin dynamics-like n=1 Tax=Polyodon spathula TaxID=7913 RepID=UPI001B7DD323|nr:LOW QUALITY PROTEIN: capping protein inhibiting regulator of actin dynamics-like [Polyodon spathula]
MDTRAFSHDSIFIPEGPEEDNHSEQVMSQENTTDKVKSLQRQIAHDIKFGQKPMSVSVRNTEDAGGSSEDEELPRNPVKVFAQMEAKSSDSGTQPTDIRKHSPLSEAGIGSGEEKQATPVKSLRPKAATAGTIESINLDAVPLSGSRLDNTAAKHKLSIKPKNQRASKKHQRLTLDQQSLVLPELEETKGKKHTEVKSKQEENKHNQSKEQEIYNEDHGLRGSKEERKRHEEHEKLQESKKQKLQEEQSLMEEQQMLREEVEYELERQRQCEIEGQKAHEAEKQHLCEMEERLHKMEEIKLHEEREEQRQCEGEAQRMHEIEHEIEAQRQCEAEELGLHEIEAQRQCEAEELRLHEIEAQKQHESEERKQSEREEQELYEIEKEKQCKAEKRQHEAEEQKLREMEELRLQELERKKKQEEQIAEEQKKKEEKEKQEELKQLDIEEERKHNIEEKEKNNEAKRQKQEGLKKSLDPQEQERIGEELRWQEMEERQTMPRPFTFKVSSGEKPVIFQKVNLSPVTLLNQQVSPSDTESEPSPKADKGSHFSFLPHTAFLVTGAQLCGTAVNLNQIKDTACKSLLGLAEDKKARDIPPVESVNKTYPEGKPRTRTRSTHESTDNQSSAAILAEWATIRSKILKSAENGKQSEREVRHHGRLSDDYTQKGVTDLHSNLRKTMSANAKFSITPAWQKFTDGAKTNENVNTKSVHEIEKESTRTGALSLDLAASPPLANKTKDSGTKDKVVKSVRIVDSTESCVFAKDLPSFLVPSPPHISNKGRFLSESQSPPENQDVASPLKKVEGTDKKGQNINDKPSPFGIKLRRTNYSLRFHNEQQADHKKKKRYSAGDNFEGVPTPLIPFGHERDIPVFPNKRSPPSTPSIRETTDNSATNVPQNASEPKSTPIKISIPVLCSESEKLPLKSPLYQKPFLAPKPALVTTPSSPLAKMDKCSFGRTVAQRTTKEDLAAEQKKEEMKADASQKSQHDEEETKEKRSFFSSINIPWREKTDRKTELIRREKPSLQSRHSLDSSRITEKGDSPQPLWITLAQQKQKGFREQQSTREERKQAKEAKLVEKQSKNNGGVISPTDNKEPSSNQRLQKPPVKEEEKKPDTILSRFERREQLKKSNTLPNSVTVEISDSTCSTPSVKEVNKRFPNSDSAQVSTEPAWLALAKRKAKAWSDCPQIIK